MICPCCSEKKYSDCCEPFHLGKEFPLTSEILMRSRYSAYAIPNGEYLMETTHPSKRSLHDIEEMTEWGKNNLWTSLEIFNNSDVQKVEFKAYYTDLNGIHHVHHELSTFKKINQRWYYFSGKHK